MAKKSDDPVWDALKELGKKHGAIVVENGKTIDYGKINRRKKRIARLIAITAIVVELSAVFALVCLLIWSLS